MAKAAAIGNGKGSGNGNGGGGSTGGGVVGGACTFLVGVLAVLLSGVLRIAHYPPDTYHPVSIGEEFIQEAGGNFTQLSRGRVHYELREPAVPSSLPPVVLIHGFSMGCRIWKPIADALAQEGGRRVLTFDLFGRGYSDAAYPCDLSLFTGQLSELLFSLAPILGPGPYDILGTSMGGAIAINFANLYPHQVRQFVLLSPAGLPVHVPFTAKLAKLPLIGDIFMPILGPVSLKTHARKGHAYPDDPALKPIFDAMGKVLMRQTSVNPGFFPALLSTLRNFPLNDMEDGYRKLGETRPENGILVVWGDLDEVTPFHHSETVMKLLGPGKAKLLVLDDCGHVDALEVPKNIAQMMPPLIAFLEGGGGK